MGTKLKKDIFDFGEIASLALSTKKVVGHLDAKDLRTVTITCKGTTNGAATLGIRVNVYYSPTGNREDWDSVAFASFKINISAGNNTQESHNFDLPELGEIKIEVENLDTGQAATSIQVWASIKRHEGNEIIQELSKLNDSINKNLLVLIGKIVKK